MKPNQFFSSIPYKIYGLVATSWLVRTILILRGGQSFNPDESRYYRSLQFGYDFVHLGIKESLRGMLSHADHFLFTLWGVIPAAVQYLVYALMGIRTHDSLYIPAIFFALFHAFNIAWIYLIAKNLQADEESSTLAALFAFLATALLYHSRHLFPYDLALFLNLSALYVGLQKPHSTKNAIFISTLATGAVLTYNGYWSMSAIVVGLPFLVHYQTPAKISRLFAAALTPFLLLLIPIVAAEALHVIPVHVNVKGGTPPHISPFLDGLIFFSSTVLQGDPTEGWFLPWAYLWNTDHLLLITWITATSLGFYPALRYRKLSIWLPIVAIFALWIQLSFSSTVLGRMVVYGRLARPMVPFMCLISGVMFSSPIMKHRKLTTAFGFLLILQTAYNWKPLLEQRWPLDIMKQVQKQYGAYDEAASIRTNEWPTPDPKTLHYHRYVLANLYYFWPAVAERPLPDGRILYQTKHPLQYLPYQYEGSAPKERELLRKTDISIRLIETKQ